MRAGTNGAHPLRLLGVTFLRKMLLIKEHLANQTVVTRLKTVEVNPG